MCEGFRTLSPVLLFRSCHLFFVIFVPGPVNIFWNDMKTKESKYCPRSPVFELLLSLGLELLHLRLLLSVLARQVLLELRSPPGGQWNVSRIA